MMFILCLLYLQLFIGGETCSYVLLCKYKMSFFGYVMHTEGFSQEAAVTYKLQAYSQHTYSTTINLFCLE